MTSSRVYAGPAKFFHAYKALGPLARVAPILAVFSHLQTRDVRGSTLLYVKISMLCILNPDALKLPTDI